LKVGKQCRVGCSGEKDKMIPFHAHVSAMNSTAVQVHKLHCAQAWLFCALPIGNHLANRALIAFFLDTGRVDSVIFFVS
jgi:hypothetical protein